MNRLPAKLLLPIDRITREGTAFSVELSSEILSDETVTFKDPVTVSLVARTAGDGFYIEGNISACAVLLCDSCLEKVEYPIEKDDFSVYIKNPETENIDLTENIREDIILTLPLKCIFKPDNPDCCSLCGKKDPSGWRHDTVRLNDQLKDLDTYFQ